MAEADLTQVNAAVDPAVADLVDALGERQGWTRRQTVATAITTLATVMDLHDEVAERYGWSNDQTVARAVTSLRVLMNLHDEVAAAVEFEIAELYLRIAAEAPAHLVTLKPDTALGWRNEKRDQPMAQVDGWFIYVDPDTDELMAEDESGRRGLFRNGEIVAGAEKPSPDEADLEPVTP